MSDEDTIGAGDRQDLTAAEYVLGVLGAEERRRAEFRIASEPRFAAEVAYWEARLGGLADAVPAVAPPATVWDGIEARLSASLKEPAERGGIWQSLAFWRTFAIASTALAAASMAGLVYLAKCLRLGRRCWHSSTPRAARRASLPRSTRKATPSPSCRRRFLPAISRRPSNCG